MRHAAAQLEVHIDIVVPGLVAVWIVGFGAAAGWLARRRARAVAVWAAIGAVIGPLALLLLERAPLGRCPACEASVQGWGTLCAWCGGDVRGGGRTMPAPALPAPAPPPGTSARWAGGAPTTQTIAARAAATRTVTPASDTAQRPPDTPMAPEPESGPPSSPEVSTARPTARRPRRTSSSRRVAVTTPATTPATTAADGPITMPSAATASAIAPVPPPQPAAPTPAIGWTGEATSASATGRAKRSRRRKEAASVAAGPPIVDFHALASAVFVTGSVGFQPGSWYTLETSREDLRVLGPLERDARAVALTRPMASLDASALNGRLVVNGEDGLVMVFMRVAGMSADAVADVIARAGGPGSASRP